MKKILMLSFLLLLLAACGDDEKSGVEYDPNLISGKWYLNVNKDSIYYHFENGIAEREVWQAGEIDTIQSAKLGKYRLLEERIVYQRYDPDLYRLRNGDLWMWAGDSVSPGYYKYTRMQ